jgi:hypothetical protein
VALRILVPRSAFVTVAQPPEWISQRTVERETGVGARSYLEDLASGYHAETIRRGKLRLTRLDDYIAFLRRRSEAAKGVADDKRSDGADTVLAEVGLRAIRGGAR